MRVTDSLLFDNFVRAFTGNRQKTSEALEQLADGRRVRHASDDPSGARTAIQLRARLARLEGYDRTATTIRSDLETVENALGGAFDLLLDARTEAQLGASGTVAEFGPALADKIDELRSELLHLANTRHGGRFLFSGTATLTQPFDDAGVYQGDAEEVRGPLEDGIAVGVSVAGDRVFQGDGDAFATLSDLSTALRSGDTDTVRSLLGDLSAQLDRVSQVRSEIGARLNLVDRVVDRHAAESLRLSTRIVEIEGANLERVAVDLAAANSSNQALSAAAGTVLGRSLFDFLA